MVVQVVVGEVREDTCLELQSVDSRLLDAYGTYLHEAVFATCVNHFSQHGVDGDRVGCRVDSLCALCTDIVCDCRQQTAVVSERHEHPVEQCHGCSLAVCSGDADKGQLLGRIAVEVGGYKRQSLPRTVYLDQRYAFFKDFMSLILNGLLVVVNNGSCTFADCSGYVFVSVKSKPLDSHEKRPAGHFPGIAANRIYLCCSVTDGVCSADIAYDLVESHSSTILIVCPFLAAVPAAGFCERTWPMPVYSHTYPQFSIA